MPSYEYECDRCGKITLFSIKVEDRDSQICKACKTSLIRIMQKDVEFRFKGTGFYKTDYGKGKK